MPSAGLLYTSSQRFQIAQALCQERGAVMVPPYDDEEIMAGQGTAGLELITQCPALSRVDVYKRQGYRWWWKCFPG